MDMPNYQSNYHEYTELLFSQYIYALLKELADNNCIFS